MSTMVMTTLRLRARRLSRSLRRFARDKRGVSAVEFAMLLPLSDLTAIPASLEPRQRIASRRLAILPCSLTGSPVCGIGLVDDNF